MGSQGPCLRVDLSLVSQHARQVVHRHVVAVLEAELCSFRPRFLQECSRISCMAMLMSLNLLPTNMHGYSNLLKGLQIGRMLHAEVMLPQSCEGFRNGQVSSIKSIENESQRMSGRLCQSDCMYLAAAGGGHLLP